MTIHRILIAALVAGATYFVADSAQAQGPVRARLAAPGIAQQYVEDEGLIGSKMYPSPRPVPAWVGHTYYTYQPFYPHKFMWSHYDVYRKRHADGGHTTTRAFYW